MLASSKHSIAGQRRRRPPLMPWSVRRALLTAANDVNLKAREVLFHAPATLAMAAISCVTGWWKAPVIAKDGQERLLAVLGPGSLIGELSLFDDQPRSATIAALKPCHLLHVSKGSFFRLADANPLVYREALKILTNRLRQTNDSMVAQGTVSVAGRVARAFSTLAKGLRALQRRHPVAGQDHPERHCRHGGGCPRKCQPRHQRPPARRRAGARGQLLRGCPARRTRGLAEI